MRTRARPCGDNIAGMAPVLMHGAHLRPAHRPATLGLPAAAQPWPWRVGCGTACRALRHAKQLPQLYRAHAIATSSPSHAPAPAPWPPLLGPPPPFPPAGPSPPPDDAPGAAHALGRAAGRARLRGSGSAVGAAAGAGGARLAGANHARRAQRAAGAARGRWLHAQGRGGGAGKGRGQASAHTAMDLKGSACQGCGGPVVIMQGCRAVPVGPAHRGGGAHGHLASLLASMVAQPCLRDIPPALPCTPCSMPHARPPPPGIAPRTHTPAPTCSKPQAPGPPGPDPTG